MSSIEELTQRTRSSTENTERILNSFYLFRVKRKFRVIRRIFKQKLCVLRATPSCPADSSSPWLKFFFLFSLFSFLSSLAFSVTLDELVGAERAAVLRAATEPLTELQQKAPKPRLLPRHGELERFVADIQKSLEPNMFVETLSLYRKPRAENWVKAEQTSLLNQLLALSTLAGIQYYSESRKAMRTFYETSRVIDNPTNKNPLPDPVYTALPDTVALYTRQKDLTFGDNVYSYNYRTGKDYIFFLQENLTAMNSGIIPAIGKNKLRSVVAVIDTGDSLLIYAAAMAKTVSFPGMGERIGASFINRAKAVLKWFDGRAGGVFR